MMRKHLLRLFMGSPSSEKDIPVDALGKQMGILRKVWEGEDYKDFGLERIFRLTLILSKLLFPGIYFEYFFGRKSHSARMIWSELYIVFKTTFPLLILYTGNAHQPFLLFLNVYFLLETFVFIFDRIYLSEHFDSEGYKRMLILLFFNFFEVVFSFAVIYSSGKYMNKPFNGYIDAVYFSMMTSSTIAYGDYFPVTSFGKMVSMLQAISTLVFLGLFFNFFNSKLKD